MKTITDGMRRGRHTSYRIPFSQWLVTVGGTAPLVGLYVEVDGLEPFLHVEAGTSLPYPRQVAVAYDVGIGIVCAEAFQQLVHGVFLCRGARVVGVSLPVESALVADAYAVGVVASGVSACHVFGSAGVYLAVLGDVVVVAYGAEAACQVACLEVFYAEVLVCTGGGAVDYD